MRKYSKEAVSKRFKLGIFSGISILVVVVIAILVNIGIEVMDISLDGTDQDIYTLSRQTTKIVKGLEKDITIYVLDSEENFPLDYKQILQQYVRLSNHVQILYRDMNVYPAFAQQYTQEDVTVDSLIVVSGEKSVYLDVADFTRTTVSEDNTMYTMSYQIEPLVTAAINKVNDGETGIIYQTTGHSELQLTNSVETLLMRDNFELKDLVLTYVTEVPEDAAVILINAPNTDFTADECKKLRTYLNNGGRLYIILDAVVENENLNALMEEYGIIAVEGIVMEQDTSMIYADSEGNSTPTYIIPKVEDTALTGGIYTKGWPMFIPVAKGLQLEDKEGIYNEGILSTSKYAYSKVDLYSDYVSREDDDIMGPFYLSVISEAETGGKMIVLSSANALTENVDAAVYGDNSEFFVNGINYLEENVDKISIRSKTVEFNRAVYSQNAVMTISGICIIGIPALILIFGALMMLYRKQLSEGTRKKAEEEPMSSEEMMKFIEETLGKPEEEVSEDTEQPEETEQFEDTEQPEETEQSEDTEQPEGTEQSEDMEQSEGTIDGEDE